MSLSPDGKAIAVLIDELDGQSDIWMVDVESGLRKRFTFTPDNLAVRRGEPVWSPDGRLLVYSYSIEDSTVMFMKRTDGGKQEELFLQQEGSELWPYDFTPDGKWVLYGREDKGLSSEDLWLAPVSGAGEPHALFETPFDEWPGTFSPDGRWLAFDSDETGRQEIFVIPYGSGEGKWQVTRDGGRFARWSADGRELFYLGLEGNIMSVTVDGTGDTFSAGAPVTLFKTDLGSGSFGGYDVDLTQDRFLVLQQPMQEAPISLFVNWITALETR
jgi:Tol biopolymer transport system component